ncbi:MAG TPA: Gfo/Idh/MocA family oxidoreductase [Bryobacteraceae bacterium]|jgi:predicted dehydrogenase|nr:Gfo/Idh/MocA family oxidoreductase [Bryobacteraceae bacterium]
MKTRVAIAGLGGAAERIHLPACRAVSEIEVVGACEIDEKRRKAMASRFGLACTFETCEEMLAAVSPDLVIVGTPPESHYSLSELALDAGAHVFCEKPFMSSIAEADRIIELARHNRRLLRVNNQYRFMTIYRETKQRLERNEFGRLFHVQCWQQMFHPPASEPNWRRELLQYTLFEFATHALDLIAYFYGDTPEAVNIFTPTCRPEFAADVVVAGVLRFPGERIAVLNFNRVTQAQEKYLEMRLDCERSSLRLSLGGVARVSVEWSRRAGRPVWKGGLLRGGQAREESGGGSAVYASAKRPEFAAATAEHLRLFLREMREPEPCLDSALQAREILRVVFAGYKSAESGETVRLK